jgi:hypothetical protein
MAISFVGATSASKGGTGTSLTIDVPSGTQNGDLLLAEIVTETNVTITAPAGWNSWGNALDISNNARHTVWFTYAWNAPANYTWTLSSATGAVGTILTYRGAALSHMQATPSVPPVAVNDNTGDTTWGPTNPYNTVPVNNCMSVQFHVGFRSTNMSTASVTPPSGWTERVEAVSTGSAPCRIEVADISANQGTNPSGSATSTAAPSTEQVWQVVLTPLPTNLIGRIKGLTVVRSTDGNSLANPVSVSVPPTVANGDVMVLAGYGITPPTGWTQQQNPNTFVVATRIANNEPTSYNVNTSATRTIFLWVLRYVGVDSSSSTTDSSTLAPTPSGSDTGSHVWGFAFLLYNPVQLVASATCAAGPCSSNTLGQPAESIVLHDRAGLVASEADVALRLRWDTVPTIASSSPADGATTHNATPTLSVTVTDPDPDNLTVTFQVATDSAFTNVVWSGTATTTGPVTNATVSTTVGTTLLSDQQYWWRANVTDGYTTSDWTTARSFWVHRTPTVAWSSFPSGTILPGTQSVSWTFTSNDGFAQTAWRIKRTRNSQTHYWNASTSSWQTTLVNNSGSATSANILFESAAGAQTYELFVDDGFGVFTGPATSTVTVHDPPTVTVTSPTGVLSTGGPNLTVNWSYAQAQSVAQATYRVRITNAAGTVIYYDSGTLSGTNTSHVITDWPSDESRPTDTTGSALRARVDVTSADGSSFAANHQTSFDLQWGVVTCTITNPPDNSVVTSSSLTVTWTFSSTRSKPQGKYRVQLVLKPSTTLYDSGWVTSTATSLLLPVQLLNRRSYVVYVQLQNSEGVRSS